MRPLFLAIFGFFNCLANVQGEEIQGLEIEQIDDDLKIARRSAFMPMQFNVEKKPRQTRFTRQVTDFKVDPERVEKKDLSKKEEAEFAYIDNDDNKDDDKNEEQEIMVSENRSKKKKEDIKKAKVQEDVTVDAEQEHSTATIIDESTKKRESEEKNADLKVVPKQENPMDIDINSIPPHR